MQIVKAIVNSRVSTVEQLLSNSLNRQQESVEKAALKLGVTIPEDGRWSGSVSSKAGTNVTRKDLLAMLDYCKRHKDVKFAIFDEYDRYMRSVNEGPYFEVMFQQLGVKVWYASESDTFNGDDAMAKFMRSMSAFRAEGSNEERQHKSISGHEKALRDGRYTFPPKPGYMKGDKPGIHQRHPTEFIPLQTALKEVASGMYTPGEALKRLNETSFTAHRSKYKIDKFRIALIDPYYAGIVEKDKQVKGRNENGLHVAMISKKEHEQILRLYSKGGARARVKRHYNPEFPLSKVLGCGDCFSEAIKFTGAVKNNGIDRNTTKYYAKYRARCCKKEYHRQEVHSAISGRLEELDYENSQRSEFIAALATVWQQKERDKLQQAKSLQKQLEGLEEKKSKLIMELPSVREDFRADYETAITKLKLEIVDLEEQIKGTAELEQDFIEFVKFALEYTNELKQDWWELDHENRVRCQQLLFPDGIYFNSRKKVGTPSISALYSLNSNKKDLRFSRKSLMVELAGTTPASIGLLVN